MKGFIKLFRQITKHWLWFADPFDRAHAWIDLLLMANWETATNSINGRVFVQERGEVVTSISFLAKRWRWSENKVRRFLKVLTAEGMVHTDGRPYGTSITIENYTFFQGGRRADGRADERTDGRADGRQSKKNIKKNKKEARARGSASDDTPAAALEENEPEGMPEWFKEKADNIFGRI